jgi:hypothetical protein
MILATTSRAGLGASSDASPAWYANLPFAADVSFEANNPTSNWNVFLQTLGLEPASTMSPSSQSQFNAPAAPQTPAAMLSFSPDQLAEAEAQKAVQSASDTAYLQNLLAPASTDTSGDGTSSGVPMWLWIVLVVAAVLLLFGGKRR